MANTNYAGNKVRRAALANGLNALVVQAPATNQLTGPSTLPYKGANPELITAPGSQSVNRMDPGTMGATDQHLAYGAASGGPSAVDDVIRGS